MVKNNLSTANIDPFSRGVTGKKQTITDPEPDISGREVIGKNYETQDLWAF